MHYVIKCPHPTCVCVYVLCLLYFSSPFFRIGLSQGTVCLFEQVVFSGLDRDTQCAVDSSKALNLHKDTQPQGLGF